MKVINYTKQDGIVTIKIQLDKEAFDVCLPQDKFLGWEDLSLKERTKNIIESQEERFLELVDENDGDFYAARKKWPVVKNIEKHPKMFLQHVQNHWLWS